MIWHSLIWCCLAVALTVSGPAWGQDYPNRQITILVGIAAGGITDVTTRQYAAVVSKNIDQNIIIENRPVAGGAVAAATVQSAATSFHVAAPPSSVMNSRLFTRSPRRPPREGPAARSGRALSLF